jgi:hypothetical protein
MTITLDAARKPNVFQAGLPAIDYDNATNPDEALAILRQARERSPIAIGPHGPELLTYQIVHDGLRDRRFRVPQGMFLAAPWKPLSGLSGPSTLPVEFDAGH